MKKVLLLILTAALVFALAMPITASAATVTAVKDGDKVLITITDGDVVIKEEKVDFEKTVTKTYEIAGYKVEIQFNGNGVNKVNILSAPDTNPPDPKQGYDTKGNIMTWNANDMQTAFAEFIQTTAKDIVLPSTALVPEPSKKQDASGDKIPANAHSGDFPGLYFYWNDQQKEDGILKVDPALFNLFKDGKFYITAKNSNAYWDFWILPDDGIETEGGYLLYQIPRNFMYLEANNKNGKMEEKKEELKNINMIFIGGDYKDAYLIIKKVWFDCHDKKIKGDNSLVSFKEGYTLGKNTIEINTWDEALNGKKVTVTENPIPGFVARQNPQTIKVKADETGKLVFENVEQPATVIIKKLWLKGSEQVEGGKVSFTNGYELGKKTVDPGTQVAFKEIIGEEWELIDISINGKMIELDKGVDFEAKAGETYKIVFTNWQPAEPTGTLSIDKNIDGDIITSWEAPDGVKIEDLIEGFYLYGTQNGANGLEVDETKKFGFVSIDSVIAKGGTIEFTNLKAGIYAVVEVLTDEGKKIFTSPGPLFVTFNGVNVVGKDDEFYVSDASVGKIVKNLNGGIYELPETWNTAIKAAGYGDILGSLEAMGAKWIWDVEDTYQYGVTGAVAEFKFNVEVDENVTVPFYFAADNAAIVYVNDKLAGFTQVALRNGNLSNGTSIGLDVGAVYIGKEVFANQSEEFFDGGWEGGWAHAYTIKIDLVEGKNNIVVVAANSKQTENPPNNIYNETNNPCGVIFGFAVPGSRTVFENTTEKMAEIVIVKEWDMFSDLDFPEVLFNIRDDKGELVYENVPPGTYKVKEGSYIVTELKIPGFTAEKENQDFEIKAGEKKTITFINVEDRATVTVVKKWDNEADLTVEKLAALEAQIKFDLALGEHILMPGTYPLSETFPETPWTWDKDGYRYTVTNEGVTVDGEKAISVTAEKDNSYKIVYNNKVVKKALPATVTIVKIWQDENGYPLDLTDIFATVNTDISFTSPFKLDVNENVEIGTDLSTIKEDISNCVYYGDTYFYIFEQISVEGNYGIVAPGADYTITFTNKLVRKPIEFHPTLLIEKEWVKGDWADENLDIFDEWVAYYIDMLNSLVSFKYLSGDVSEDKLVLNTPIVLDVFGEQVAKINFMENPIHLGRYGGYDYTITPKLVVVYQDGNEIPQSNGVTVDFTAEKNNNYRIIFTNEISRKKKPTGPDINDKIPSKTHVDRWWDEFGILAYGASSGNDKNEYVIAFSKDFWEKNESVTIGFGTQNSWTHKVTITLENDTLVFTDEFGTTFTFLQPYNGGSLFYDNHYTSPKEKNHEFIISIGVMFENPWMSGAKQLWLLNITPKQEPLAAAALFAFEPFESEPEADEALEDTVTSQEVQDEESLNEEALNEEALEEEALEEEALEEEALENNVQGEPVELDIMETEPDELE